MVMCNAYVTEQRVARLYFFSNGLANRDRDGNCLIIHSTQSAGAGPFDLDGPPLNTV